MNIVQLQFAWHPQGPLLSGYDYKFSREAELVAPGEKKNIQYRSRNQQQELTPSLLATSVKGVFRSTAAWLMEREGQRRQASAARRRYITADYAGALPTKGPLSNAVNTVEQVNRLCPIGRVFGGGGIGEGGNALRQQGLVRFSFNQMGDVTDALFGTVRESGERNFAWEIASDKHKALTIEQLVVDDAPYLQIQVQAGSHRHGVEDQELAVAILCLAADLISTGFFRFGRYTSRGYGWVRLTEPRGRNVALASLLDGDTNSAWTTAVDGATLARALLQKDPHSIIGSVIDTWLQE